MAGQSPGGSDLFPSVDPGRGRGRAEQTGGVKGIMAICASVAGSRGRRSNKLRVRRFRQADSSEKHTGREQSSASEVVTEISFPIC